MAVLTKYTVSASQKEDVLDVIQMLSPEDTAFLSRIGVAQARQANHEWLTDTLESATATGGATVEGATAVTEPYDARARLLNYTQITQKTIDISGTLEATSMYGMESEYAYRLEKAMKEWKIRVDQILLTSTSAVGTSAVARSLSGLIDILRTNIVTGSGGSCALTETAFNDLLQSIFSSGGVPDTAFVNGFQKRRISAFATSNVRYQEPGAEGRIRNRVAVYESDFGDIEVVLERYMPAATVPVLEIDGFKIAYLRKPFVKPLADIGDSKRAMIIGEYTFEYLKEPHSGKLSAFATS